MNGREFKTFEEFWAHYLSEHSRPATRQLHAAGTLLSLIVIASLVAAGWWLWLPLALVPGYGLSWIGHFCVERNTPATFGHPGWSLRSDFKMVWLVLTGRMGAELARLGIGR